MKLARIRFNYLSIFGMLQKAFENFVLVQVKAWDHFLVLNILILLRNSADQAPLINDKAHGRAFFG